ncbi:uncharacterized protein K452DRAFT_284088 [Aplosporella prunicola CBS 121167]|uniref:Uncharacterized protein n=1 Tax=Aplosporella prunicola CBS 121167 TaxID=1176127 RepID=A0A6A6BNP2_9PEZI|nr:uncharacterized protein K452DRAFT_284088 [Aplosporella prunicola CBS 121167]KAF2145722.1 hypothetical protein K452DRAFT_284088 [Aplosporella prunicola CBS 121167]
MLRYFALPRPYVLRVQKSTEHPDKQNRYFWLDWEPEPWYVKDSFVNRWRPLAWFKWITGRPYPGNGEYRSQGYLIHKVGPVKLEGKGMAQFKAGKERLMAQGRGGCPFAP